MEFVFHLVLIPCSQPTGESLSITSRRMGKCFGRLRHSNCLTDWTTMRGTTGPPFPILALRRTSVKMSPSPSTQHPEYYLDRFPAHP